MACSCKIRTFVFHRTSGPVAQNQATMKKRTDISRLRRDQPLFFKVGLIVALLIAILAFQWTVPGHPAAGYPLELSPGEPEIEVVRTHFPEPRRTAPPVFMPSAEAEPLAAAPLPEPVLPAEPGPEPLAFAEPSPAVWATAPPLPSPPAPGNEPPPIFQVVEEMPAFGPCREQGHGKSERQACSDRALLQYLYSQIRYPPIARESALEGTVVARFVIEKDGSISQAEIMRDIGGGCGKEVLRVLNDMPQWSPGLQRGRPVRVQMSLPVRFRLE
ncbi:energy transducer TonB [Phaeodactylibacter luteus]|uniref:Energy transducer TonB n=2 Tax=Phaeodactylibacter luteus TaxID=1564516 RepID=A0A5C6RXJ5_9BACT|nr:energy transducer TonB [Phaeodactylibacter luteus]